jgi:Nif-specific regulatory protein
VSPRLVFLEGPLAGREVALAEGVVTVGREGDCSIPLNDGGASRHHFEIRLEGESAEIRDLKSRNGTLVNGVRVERAPLRCGDEIRIGTSRIVFRRGEPGASRGPASDTATIVLKAKDSVYLSPASPDVSARAIRDLKALLQFGCEIHQCRTEQDVHERLIAVVFAVTVADCAAMILFDPEAEGGVVVRGMDKRGTERSPKTSQTIIERILAERVAILENDVQRDEALASAESLVVRQVHSVLAVPLEVRGEISGLLYAESSNPEARFEESDLQLLTALGNVASLAVQSVRRVEALATENQRLKEEIGANFGIVGESGPVKDVLRTIARVAPIDSTVLITGESGTGKELAARAIHAGSNRAHQPFIAINCAALTETLLESELFGHEKGAFTGAIAQKKGKIEAAEGGVLFLDELGEMSPSLQVKLLRVLQEKEYERVGGTRTIKADVRVVAATNRDLRAMSTTREFRPDLYYRLNVVAVRMPPLRERREDIPVLAQHFTAKFSAQTGRRVLGLSSRAKACLLRHDWPGNIRELQNAIERAVALGSSEWIEPEDLPETVLEGSAGAGGTVGTDLHDQLNEAKRQILVRAIDAAGNNYTEAAHQLGIHPNHLFRLVRTLNLTPKRQKAGPKEGKPPSAGGGR